MPGAPAQSRNCPIDAAIPIATVATSFFIDDTALTVIGIIHRVSTHGELLGGVLVPEPTAAHLFGWRGAASLVVDVRPRTADLVARQAPLAIDPADPTSNMFQATEGRWGSREVEIVDVAFLDAVSPIADGRRTPASSPVDDRGQGGMPLS